MTALVAISDQSDINMDFKDWVVFLTISAITWAVISRREHVRRQKRKKDGRA